STASATASAARSMSITEPLRIPREGASPVPWTTRPSEATSATAQQTFVVPRSRAATRRARLTLGDEYSRAPGGGIGAGGGKTARCRVCALRTAQDVEQTDRSVTGTGTGRRPPHRAGGSSVVTKQQTAILTPDSDHVKVT